MLADGDRVDSLLEYLSVNPEEVFGEESKNSPHYEENGDGTDGVNLVIEGQRVVTSLKLPKADLLLLWAASYPVFNQKCPKKSSKNVLVFITEHVFEKRGGSCVLGNRVLARIQKITKMTE